MPDCISFVVIVVVWTQGYRKAFGPALMKMHYKLFRKVTKINPSFGLVKSLFFNV